MSAVPPPVDGYLAAAKARALSPEQQARLRSRRAALVDRRAREAGLTQPQLRALRFYAAPYGDERRKIGMPRWDVIERLVAVGLVEPLPDRMTFAHQLTDAGRARLAEIDEETSR